MPSRAKMTMKRNKSRSSDAIDCIELSKEATRFDKDLQYLQNRKLYYTRRPTHDELCIDVLGNFENSQETHAT